MKVDANSDKVGHPCGVVKYDDFRNREFGELYEWLSAPRSPGDTNMDKEEHDKKPNPYG
jgi:hypothetical protein